MFADPMMERRERHSVNEESRRARLSTKKDAKNSWGGTKIGIITAGDDAQGVNAAIRAVVRMGNYMGCITTYIKRGFLGLVEGNPENFEMATYISTTDIIGKAGTIIKSLKSDQFKHRSGRLLAAKHLVLNGITNLVVIGGDGTIRGCLLLKSEWVSLLRELDDRNQVDRELLQEHRHLNIIILPCSITNDLCGTDMCIGTDSALFRIIEAVDNIKTTSSSTSMAFVLEVMGGFSGYLALTAGIISDASMVFIPEYPCQGDWKDELYLKVRSDLQAGAESILCIVSEGARDKNGVPISSECVEDVLTKKLGLNTKITVLGHFQRGGVPSAFDRLLATRLGYEAIEYLKTLKPEDGPGLVTYCENEICLVPAETCLYTTEQCRECIKNKKFDDAIHLKGLKFRTLLNSYNLLHSMRSSPISTAVHLAGVSKIGVMRVGKATIGQCWVLKAVVGYCQIKHVCPIVIADGFEGLVARKFSVMSWEEVKETTGSFNACLGASRLTAAEVGLDKIEEAIGDIGLDGILIIGGFPAYESMSQMGIAKEEYKLLQIPMMMLPMTVLNNVPGTDVAIGSDTALNEIMSYCDTMKRAARGYQNCVFIVETAGHNCGYLATVGGLVCGADAAYVQQEPFGLETLLKDATNLKNKFQSGVNLGLILTSERANENYNTSFIHKLYSEEGMGVFTCRQSTIGHLQVGGLPSPIDRCLAICCGFTVISRLIDSIDQIVPMQRSAVRTSARMSNKEVLDVSGSTMKFEPVSKLVAESDFSNKLPLYMWWMKLRPVLRILSGLALHEGTFSQVTGSKANAEGHKKSLMT